MNPVVWTVILAGAWLALTGDPTLGNLVLGLVCSGLSVALAQPAGTARAPSFRPWATLRFAVYYLKEMVVSNLRVARGILDPTMAVQPAVVAVPLEEHSDEELLVLTSLLSFTPGTLVLDLSEDRRTLYVHAMDAPDIEALRGQLKDDFERRVMEMVR